MTAARVLTALLFITMAKASANFLIGTWENELQSHMIIDAFTSNAFTGIYKTAVSGNGTAMEAPVRGTFNPASATAGTISFTVDWQYNDKDGKLVISSTAWCGVVRDKTMQTQWHLTRYGEPADDWDSTSTNKDVFNKL